ncbi:MAG: NAD(P)-binding domain-containing protein, partial [Deinococcus sp.]|nr:NAD(P)-binding domain-containing protein [Deinococcus sp.]
MGISSLAGAIMRYDLVIVGAGPTGLACAIEAQQLGLDYLVLEKGCLVDALYRFPVNMVFFTTPELLEIGELPLVCAREKPTRQEALQYYRKVADRYQLNVLQYQRVTAVTGSFGAFTVSSLGRAGLCQYQSRTVVVATGYYDHPNWLGVSGEELPKVAHYYSEPHSFWRRQVAVVGGANSAAEAAL